MNKYMIFLFSFCMVMVNFSMERVRGLSFGAYATPVVYRHATIEDILDLLACIDAIEESPDVHNLVVLPKKFRANALRNAIEEQRLFVAYHGDRLVGFKKMYVVPQEELHELLHDEIRCTCAASVDGDPVHTQQADLCYIYTGGDYTDPAYRHDGACNLGFSVNNELFNYAFETLDIPVDQKIALVFGVTNANAGDSILAPFCRPQSIKKSFERMRGHQCTQVSRYHAEKPTFEAEAQKCVPLEQGVPGYGYVLEEL